MDDELRRLRARAYGPDADIADDPVALARLEELERRARAPEPQPPAEPEPADEPAGDPVAEEQEEVDAAPHRSGLWWAVVWAASLVVVALVASLTAVVSTVMLTRPVSDADAQQVDVLELGSDFLAPRFLGIEQRADSRGYRDYLGLTILVVRGTWYGDTDDECLVIMRTDDVDPNTDSLSGPLYTACSAGAFPAVLQLRVNDELPAELRERFPVDTGLRFVLDDSRVGVFVAGD